MSVVEELKNNPTCLLEGTVKNSELLELVKSLFDPITKGNSVLDEVYVEGLDATQVWPQTRMILEAVTDNILFEKIPALKSVNIQKSNEMSQDEADEADEADGVDDDDDDEESDAQSNNDSEDFDNINLQGDLRDDYDDEDNVIQEKREYTSDYEDDHDGELKNETPVIKKDAFGLNDEFFSIDDFNKQILAQESNGNYDDDDEIDYFADLGDDEDEELDYYNDFFGSSKDNKQIMQKASKKERKLKEGELDENDYDEGVKSAMVDFYGEKVDEQEIDVPLEEQRGNLSSFERQQLEIQKQIAQLEKEAIAEKKWAMKGEAKAKDRPQDALLDEDLEFERTAKPVPVITQEVTESLEEMIRRRIKEGNFDDLPRRILSDVTQFKKSALVEVSEQKSSKSLAEEYAEDRASTEAEVSEELQQAHNEIKDMFKTISYKLDALSSAHFIPKPAQKAIDIKVNAPTISMEDAQPLTQSSASTLAPQEIYKASNSSNADEIQLKSGTVFSRDELSREDKQRIRRANKRKRARDAYEREATKSKKSKKQDVMDTLSKAKNVTVIDNKGQRRDIAGNVKKDKVQQGTSALKL